MVNFQVEVKRPPEDRVAFVKALRTVGAISLKRATEIAAHLERVRNSTVVAGLGQRTAEHIARTLRASGADVVVRESAVNTPMMCSPEADHRYKWDSFRTIVKSR